MTDKGNKMTVDFRLPHLGDGINSADVIKVLVYPGDKLLLDQVVVEIETDKATVEIPSDVAGIVKEVFVKEGMKANVGEALIAIEVDSLELASPSTSRSGLTIDSVEVRSEKQEVRSESIEEENSKSEIHNSKSQIESENPLTTNQLLRQSFSEASQSQTTFTKLIEHSNMPKAIIVPRNISKVVVPAAPSVRRFAREIGIDISHVRGSGNYNRISIDDVKIFAKNLNQQTQKSGMTGGAAVQNETIPDFSKWGEIERQPMSNVRRKTSEHLSYAWATIPHVTQFDKSDITELEKLRKQFGKKVEDAGGKLTVTAILLKVIASALKVFPQFNSSVDMEKNEIIYKKFINIGVAVDTDRGLLVPVIRDVGKKNIIQLSIELQEISKKARDKKLSLDDMQGGCFTISNLGGIGGTYFTPIVNSPEVAILGVSKSSYEPVFIQGNFEPRLMMPLSLSYDHRIIDGADGIRFLRWIIQALENSFLISLEG